MYKECTTAVEDIDKNKPTKTPSEALAPHNCRRHKKRSNHDVQIAMKNDCSYKVFP